MALRINHNIAAINAHRNLGVSSHALSKNLEKLSSGMKINRAADSPAALVISEHMRGQIVSLKQATMNSETAVSMIQTAESTLSEMNAILVSMRQLAIHASNEGSNDQVMLEADQAELINSLRSIDRIAENAQFGNKKMLDGNMGATGVASGQGFQFIGVTADSVASPPGGYEVRVTAASEKAEIQGTTSLTQELIDQGEKLIFQEDGKTVKITTKPNESIDRLLLRMQDTLNKEGLHLTVSQVGGRLKVTHNKYGADYGFSVSSTTAGVLSTVAANPVWVQNGTDIEGTIDGQIADGKGQVLTASKATKAIGLSVKYTEDVLPDDMPAIGKISMQTHSLIFQVGGNYGQITKALLPNMRSSQLGVNIDNSSNYNNISEIDLRTFDGAQNAMLVVDKAMDQVSGVRAILGAIQKNTLESNLRSLAVAKESLTNAESVIRDTDMASEMSDLTKNQIMNQASLAALAQANQIPQNVLSLLK